MPKRKNYSNNKTVVPLKRHASTNKVVTAGLNKFELVISPNQPVLQYTISHFARPDACSTLLSLFLEKCNYTLAYRNFSETMQSNIIAKLMEISALCQANLSIQASNNLNTTSNSLSKISKTVLEIILDYLNAFSFRATLMIDEILSQATTLVAICAKISANKEIAASTRELINVLSQKKNIGGKNSLRIFISALLMLVNYINNDKCNYIETMSILKKIDLEIINEIIFLKEHNIATEKIILVSNTSTNKTILARLVDIIKKCDISKNKNSINKIIDFVTKHPEKISSLIEIVYFYAEIKNSIKVDEATIGYLLDGLEKHKSSPTLYFFTNDIQRNMDINNEIKLFIINTATNLEFSCENKNFIKFCMKINNNNAIKNKGKLLYIFAKSYQVLSKQLQAFKWPDIEIDPDDFSNLNVLAILFEKKIKNDEQCVEILSLFIDYLHRNFQDSFYDLPYFTKIVRFIVKVGKNFNTLKKLLQENINDEYDDEISAIEVVCDALDLLKKTNFSVENMRFFFDYFIDHAQIASKAAKFILFYTSNKFDANYLSELLTIIKDKSPYQIKIMHHCLQQLVAYGFNLNEYKDIIKYCATDQSIEVNIRLKNTFLPFLILNSLSIEQMQTIYITENAVTTIKTLFHLNPDKLAEEGKKLLLSIAESYFNAKHYTYGPLEKTFATFEIEKLLKKISKLEVLSEKHVVVSKNLLDDYILKINNEEFNLSLLLRNANLTHFTLETKEVEKLAKLIPSEFKYKSPEITNDNIFKNMHPILIKAIANYTHIPYQMNAFFRGELLFEDISNKILEYFIFGCIVTCAINTMSRIASRAKKTNSITITRVEYLTQQQIKERAKTRITSLSALTSTTLKENKHNFHPGNIDGKITNACEKITTHFETKVMPLSIQPFSLAEEKEYEVLLLPGEQVSYNRCGIGDFSAELLRTPQYKQENSIIEVALIHAFEKYLCHSYSSGFSRENHDIRHTYRKVLYIEQVIKYFAQFSSDENFKSFCKNLNTNDIEWLQIALIFSVTGRDGEESFHDAPGKYQKYKQVSAKHCKAYLDNATLLPLASTHPTQESLTAWHKNIVQLAWVAQNDVTLSNENITRYLEQHSNALLQMHSLVDTQKLPEYIQNIGNPDYTSENTNDIYVKHLLSFAHDLDLNRCYEPQEYYQTINRYDNLITKNHAQSEALKDLLRYAAELISAFSNLTALYTTTYTPTIFRQQPNINLLRLKQVSQTVAPPVISQHCAIFTHSKGC